MVGAAELRTGVRTKGLPGGTSKDCPAHDCLPDGPKPCRLEVGLWGTTVSVQTPTRHSAQRWVHRPIMVADTWLPSAGFYTGWLLPAAVVGTLVFLVGCFMVFSDTPT